MIVLETFDLVKALSAEHAAPAAPATPSAPSAPAASSQSAGQSAVSSMQSSGPKPTSQPRSGHKYVKRWWDGGRWQYEYPGEAGGAQPHGPLHHGKEEHHDVPHTDPEQAMQGKKLKVPKREHVLELPEGHNYGPGQEQQAYQETLGAAFKPGQKHENIPSPDGKGTYNLETLKNGKIMPTDAQGQPLMKDSKGKPKPFDNYGQYEEWYRGTAMKPARFQDANKKPWLDMVPVPGRVSKEEGTLTPPTDYSNKARLWKIVVSEGADPALTGLIEDKSRKGHVGYAVSREDAVKKINERRKYVESMTGHQFGWDASAGEAPAAASGSPTMERQVATMPEIPTDRPHAPVLSGQAAAGGAAPAPMGAQQPGAPRQPPKENDERVQRLRDEMQKYGWDNNVPNERTKKNDRKMMAPPEVKERLVQQTAMQFSPMIMQAVSSMVKRDHDMQTDPKYWQRQLLGDVELGEQTAITPEPGSILHHAISRTLDRYRPEEGIPLTAWVHANLPRDMLDVAKQARKETYSSATGADEAKNAHTLDSLSTSSVGGKVTSGLSSGAVVGRGEKPVEEAPAGEEAEDVNSWKEMQPKKLRAAFADGKIDEKTLTGMLGVLQDPRFKGEHHVGQFIEKLNQMGLGDHVVGMSKSFKIAIAVALIKSQMAKSLNGGFITKDKKIDPTHTYSHMEGDKDHPRFYFRDAMGNFVRYTNAPSGHTDASSRAGDPHIHPAEPTMETAPDFYDPQGRKLTRGPYPGAQVQWNPNYHPTDPENLWVGRWVNPLTGEHEHTYVDSDMRMIPKLYIHQQNALVDVRLPVFRKYVRSLIESPHLKDKIVGTVMALLDQGRFRAQEIAMLTVSSVKMEGAYYKIGHRLVYGDHKFRTMMTLLTRNRHPDEPLFAIPIVKKNGEIDTTLVRRVGPHFLACTFDLMGFSLPAMQTYHASQTFSREVQRMLLEAKVPWESAEIYATAAVALEMGHDLTQEPDIERALPVIRDLLIDPVVIEVLKENAKKLGLVSQDPVVLPLPPPVVQFVSFDLTTRTSDEQEFSKWLHTFPIHMNSDVKPPVQVPSQDAPFAQAQQPNPPNSPSQQEQPAEHPPGSSAEEDKPLDPETLKSLLEQGARSAAVMKSSLVRTFGRV
jgi:hypothetical protein